MCGQFDFENRNYYNTLKEINMKLSIAYFRAILLLCVGLCFSFAAHAQPGQSLPPELQELTVAMRTHGHPLRLLGEIRRIKTAYPNSMAMGQIDSALLEVTSKIQSNFNKLLSAQREIIDSSTTENRFGLFVAGASLLVHHQSVAKFPKPELLETIKEYKSAGQRLLDNPEFMAAVPANRRSALVEASKNLFELPLAKALLMNGDVNAAAAVLEEYEKNGTLSGFYYRTLGELLTEQKREKKALDAFCAAAAEGDADAKSKAQAVYTKINGKKAGFDDFMEPFLARLPFEPEHFNPPADWGGKAVLAELFTGSECPPCVGADFGFDGLIESYPAKYLAILEYHLPIPLPDPMMNPASEKRGDFYSIKSTPSVVIEGTKPVPGGGSRRDAKGLFQRYKNEIDPHLAAPPVVTINAKATLAGDSLKVDCEFSKIIEGAEYNVALVQTEVKYKGNNEIIFHKMVVRDVQTLQPSLKASMSFDIPQIEKTTEAYLKKVPDLRTRHHAIDRNKLQIVVFVQDKNTKRVHNAFVAGLDK
jgi:tetratricopeptide (TPR) repeat protein